MRSVQVPERASRSSGQAAGPGVSFGHRPALDGLRAIAVIIVIAFHLNQGWATGGFIGVDIFFVLSGYLITALLLTERARTGTIDLVRFWVRRARRLLPALLVLMAAVITLAPFTATRDELGMLRLDGLATLSYVANWRFAATGEPYFEQFAAPSPLRHMWSLAVEEQFYLLWPLVLVAVFAFARRRTRALLVIGCAGTVASVAALALLYGGDPSRAYYGTDTRVHEILVGAVLAIVLHRLAARPGSRERRAARVLGPVGIAGLVAAVATLDSHQPGYFHGGSVLVAAAVVALVLALEWDSPRSALSRALSTGPLCYVGRLSYGLYLWHWPIIVWVGPELTGLGPLPLDALQVALTAAAAATSYHLVEMPLRHGNLAALRNRARRVAAVPAAVTGLAIGLLAVTANATATPLHLNTNVAVRVPSGTVAEAGPDAPRVAVVGDALAAGLLPALSTEARDRGWSLVPAAYAGCPVATGYQVNQNGRPYRFSERCDEPVREAHTQLVRDHDPEVVLWAGVRELTDRRSDGELLEAGSPAWRRDVRDALDDTYRRLSARGADLVIAKVVPSPWPDACADARAGIELPAVCASNATDPETVRTYNRLLTDLATEHPTRVHLTSLRELTCPDGACTADDTRDEIADDAGSGSPTRPDGLHFGPQAAPRVADRLAVDVAERLGR